MKITCKTTALGFICLLASACVADPATDQSRPPAAATAADPARADFELVTPTNFDSGGAVSRQFHLNAESYLTMATVSRSDPARDLVFNPNSQLAAQPVTHRDGSSTLKDYVQSDPLLDGVIVAHGNEIVFEAYPNMQPWRRHFAWSVTKIVTATAVAALAQRERLDMSAPVGRYVTALQGSAWDSIPIQNVADMASGIDCLDSDGYQDNTTCVYATEESLGITAPTGRNLDFIEQLQSMQSHTAPGTKTEYVSANTQVLMLVIEAVTGKPYAHAIQELIWRPIAPEADALMAISEQGYAYAAGGLHARLRDLVRFGQIYTQPRLSQVLDTNTIQAMTSAGLQLNATALAPMQRVFGDDLPTRSAWQWDLIWADGGHYKAGYLGQGLYVDPAKKLIIAWFGTGLDYNKISNSMLPIARQLAAGEWRKPPQLEHEALKNR